MDNFRYQCPPHSPEDEMRPGSQISAQLSQDQLPFSEEEIQAATQAVYGDPQADDYHPFAPIPGPNGAGFLISSIQQHHISDSPGQCPASDDSSHASQDVFTTFGYSGSYNGINDPQDQLHTARDVGPNHYTVNNHRFMGAETAISMMQAPDHEYEFGSLGMKELRNQQMSSGGLPTILEHPEDTLLATPWMGYYKAFGIEDMYGINTSDPNSGNINAPYGQNDMGQEASQVAVSEVGENRNGLAPGGARRSHAVTTGQPNGWTTINSLPPVNRQHNRADVATKDPAHTDTNVLKRKRSARKSSEERPAPTAAAAVASKANGKPSVSPSGDKAAAQKPAYTVSETPEGFIEYSVPPATPTVTKRRSSSQTKRPRTARRSSATSASSLDSVLPPSSRKVRKSRAKPKSKSQSSETESEIDGGANNLLSAIAGTDSDDEEEHNAQPEPKPVGTTSPPIDNSGLQATPNVSAPTQALPKVQVQAQSHLPPPHQPQPQYKYPPGAPNPHIHPSHQYGWRQHQPAVGTHYTIYSPNVQTPSHGQARQPILIPEESESPDQLTAHEEAQLRDEGRFTRMEQSFLKDALTEYCAKHNISIDVANDYVCGKAREGNIPNDFWEEICKPLPQRTKNSIQRAAKRIFRNNQTKGFWTQEEEEALAEAYEKAPDQWAKICEDVPGRSAEQCRDRWRNYTQNGQKLIKGPWTDEEETMFIGLCKSMLVAAILDLENKQRAGQSVPDVFDPKNHLNFTAISQMMNGSRSRLQCRNKWHKIKGRPEILAAMQKLDVEGSPLQIVAAKQTPAAGATAPLHGLPMPSSNAQKPNAASPVAVPGSRTLPGTPFDPRGFPASSAPAGIHQPSTIPVTSYNRVSPPMPSRTASALPPAKSPELLACSRTSGPLPTAYAHGAPPSKAISTHHAQTPTTLPAMVNQHATVTVPAPPPHGLPYPSPAQLYRRGSNNAHAPSWLAAPPPVPQIFNATPPQAVPGKEPAQAPFLAPKVRPGPKAKGAESHNGTIPVSHVVPHQHLPSIGDILRRPGSSGGLANPSLQQHSVHTVPAGHEPLLRPQSDVGGAGPITGAAMSPQAQGRRLSSGDDTPASGSDAKSDGRPVRKKQKTAKAMGDA